MQPGHYFLFLFTSAPSLHCSSQVLADVAALKELLLAVAISLVFCAYAQSAAMALFSIQFSLFL
jgi:hypothetical protein